MLGKLLPKCNTLNITSYCLLKVISYITILLSLNCNALHYFWVTFTKISDTNLQKFSSGVWWETALLVISSSEKLMLRRLNHFSDSYLLQRVVYVLEWPGFVGMIVKDFTPFTSQQAPDVNMTSDWRWTPTSERRCFLVENENRVDVRTQRQVDVRTQRHIDVRT